MLRPTNSTLRAAVLAGATLAGVLLLWLLVLLFVLADRGHALVPPPIKLSMIDFAGGFIAVCAFVITLYSTWTTRVHNRLSIRPCLSLEMSISPRKRYHVSVKNAGPGVAIIKQWQLILVDSTDTDTNLLSSRDLTARVQFPRLVDFTRYYPGHAIQSGEETEFIGTDPDPNSPEDARAFYEMLKKVRIEYVYASIYDEEWEDGFSGP